MDNSLTIAAIVLLVISVPTGILVYRKLHDSSKAKLLLWALLFWPIGGGFVGSLGYLLTRYGVDSLSSIGWALMIFAGLAIIVHVILLVIQVVARIGSTGGA